MNKIINELLNSNARVIIPDFGAFIIKQKTPRLVVFNEFLRYNDGLLIDYVSASDAISKDLAKAKVSEYVEELNKKLSGGEAIIFEGIGKLVKESSGKLNLVELSASGTPAPKKEKKTTSDKESKTAKETAKKDETVIIEEKKDQKPLADKEEKETKPVDNLEKKEEIKQTEKTEVELDIEKKEKEPEPPDKKTKEEKITVKPIKPPEEKEAPKKPPEEVKPVTRSTKPASKKNTTQIIIWILLILIVNGAIVSWFVFNDKITSIFKKDKKAATEISTQNETPPVSGTEEPAEEIASPDIEQEESMTQQAEEPAPVIEKPVVKATPVSTQGKQYYIVAGCFREEQNADKLVKELKNDGYRAEKFGKIGSLHAVSFGAYADKSAALVELKNIRNAGHEEAWIIYY